MILDAPELSYALASSWLDDVAQDLMQNSDLVRIKKLLIYTCTHIWQVERSQVNASDLRALLEQVVNIAPTLDALHAHLDAVAHSLNKATEYSALAASITQSLREHYPRSLPIAAVEPPDAMYRSVTQVLSAESEEIRIKKLLILVCHKTWIREPEKLREFNLFDLVQSLHQLAPNSESLQLLLASRISKLSKKAEYQVIAYRILQAFQPLYNQDLSLTELAAESTELMTGINHSIASKVEHSSPGLPPNLPASSHETRVIRYQDIINDLFDLRLELMRYTNPLRVKILLFSVLHAPLQSAAEQYLMLKNYELDDLLHMLLETHKLYDDLKASLNKIVPQMDEPQTYRNVATIVLKAVQSYYAAPATDRGLPQTKPEQSTDFLKAQQTDDATRPEYSQLLLSDDRRSPIASTTAINAPTLGMNPHERE